MVGSIKSILKYKKYKNLHEYREFPVSSLSPFMNSPNLYRFTVFSFPVDNLKNFIYYIAHKYDYYARYMRTKNEHMKLAKQEKDQRAESAIP